MIEVTDESGNLYYKTYYKRAQGLIKKGRARLISENRICLTCPTNHISNNSKSEDKKMLNESRDIVEFVQDKINGLYEQYKGAAPGEYDEQISGGMIAIMKQLLDTTVKIEALDKTTHLELDSSQHMVDIFRAILNYNS